MGVEEKYRYFKRLLIFFLAVMVIRLWHLQVIRGDELRRLSEQNRIRIQKVYAPRGMIFDRKGRILADTRPSFNLYIIREDMRDFRRNSRWACKNTEY